MTATGTNPSLVEATAHPAPALARSSTAGDFWLALALALVYTLLNAIKPVHIDDATYYAYARQIAAHPTDPYGFSLMFLSRLLPANQVLAPPVLPYWWAPAIALFGPRPFLWKLWLLPFSLIFVLSLGSLLRRFARGMEPPLLCLTVLSPLFLPSLNLMLDVPAEALSLLALVVFLRAIDRNAYELALAAGVVAGLAMQTKYTALLMPVVMLIAAVLARRPRLWIWAMVPAISLFAVWEVYIADRYGQSHFLLHLGQQRHSLGADLDLGIGLLTQLGGTSVVLGILALAALTRRAWPALVGAAVTVLAYVCLAVGSVDLNAVLALDIANLGGNDVLFGAFGFFVVGTWLIAAWILWKRPSPAHRDVVFLAAWLAIEIAGCFAVSPYPAARRLLGIAIPATLLVGRLAAEGASVRPQRWLVWGITIGGMALGGLFYVVDVSEAVDEKQAVADCLERIGPQPPGTTIWHTAYWGFQFYAEQAGVRKLAPETGPGGTNPKPVHLHAGDWLLVVEPPILRDYVPLGDNFTETGRVDVSDDLPLSVVGFYAGRTPLHHRARSRVRVHLRRITGDAVIASGFSR